MKIEVDPDWWRTLFDEIYLLTDARTVDDPERTRREVDVYCGVCLPEPQHEILDLCGGHGRHSLELSARGFRHCTVFDYSSALLAHGTREAERRNLPLRFIQGDARDTRLPPAAYDKVLLLGNSLGYFSQPEADLAIFRECLRVLKPGGMLLVDVADGDTLLKKITPVSWHEIGSDTVVCRKRQFDRRKVRVREMVLSKKTGLIRDRTYAIGLYDSDLLIRMMKRAGFSAPRVHTDFTPYTVRGDLGFMNSRMLATAQKDA